MLTGLIEELVKLFGCWLKAIVNFNGSLTVEAFPTAGRVMQMGGCIIQYLLFAVTSAMSELSRSRSSLETGSWIYEIIINPNLPLYVHDK